MARILIVDDDPDTRDLIRDLLSQRGYQLDEAANGLEALEKIKKNSYDLVILDRAMPRMTGLQVLDKLRAAAADIKPKIIMCTSSGLMKQVDEAFRCGADDYISKPLDLELLVKKVARHVKPSAA